MTGGQHLYFTEKTTEPLLSQVTTQITQIAGGAFKRGAGKRCAPSGQTAVSAIIPSLMHWTHMYGKVPSVGKITDQSLDGQSTSKKLLSLPAALVIDCDGESYAEGETSQRHPRKHHLLPQPWVKSNACVWFEPQKARTLLNTVKLNSTTSPTHTDSGIYFIQPIQL